jgi:hypothetical protein
VSRCNEIGIGPYDSRFVPHILLSPEGLKVGRHHGDMVGSASHSEQLKAILYLWPTLEPLQWDREMEWRDT